MIEIKDGIVESTADVRTLEKGEIGELIIGGPHVVQDYYRNPEAVRKNKIKDSETGFMWHRMGDTGYFDSDDYFWITGRCHSTIRKGNHVLHPQIVEQCVYGENGENGAIEKVAAVGVKTVDEKICVVVVIQMNKEKRTFEKWGDIRSSNRFLHFLHLCWNHKKKFVRNK